jgi:hypothetical protein
MCEIIPWGPFSLVESSRIGGNRELELLQVDQQPHHAGLIGLIMIVLQAVIGLQHMASEHSIFTRQCDYSPRIRYFLRVQE